MRARWIAAFVGGTAALAMTALGQGPAEPVPVLHEDVRSPITASSPRPRRTPDPPTLLGQDPAAGHNPTAIRDDQKILPEPEPTSQPAGEEPIHGRGGFGADRRTENIPDDKTSGDDTLRYVEVFNPSVVPFKRMSALDAVRADYTLAIGDTSQHELRVTGAPTPGYDRFWGSMLIDLRPGEDVPIPSVAPEMRVVSYEVEPRTQLSFSVDGADNFYVRSDEPDARGVHRLIFLVEAHPRYFAPSVPRGIRVSDLRTGRVRALPPRVQEAAALAHRRIGLRREMALNDALDRLVSYFRAFAPKPLAHPSGDIYADLVSEQAGVCRHRAFAFMITANALGIPTRFVSNEAHAWVEVWVPRERGTREGGWLRIDLGGSALSLEVKNAAGKTMYRPRGNDPFPKPEPYAENYTRLEGDIDGLTEEQIAEAQSPRAAPSGPGTGGSGGAGGAEGAAASGGATTGGEGTGAPGEGEGEAGGTDDPAVPGPGPGMPPKPDPAQLRNKRPTSIRVTEASPTGFRGEDVVVDGVLTGEADVGVANQHVAIYLAPAGRDGTGAKPVGFGLTGPDGRFHATAHIPYEFELTEYEVFAYTPGDDRHQPATSR